MTRIASLGMYDHPAQQAANDRLWAAFARKLRRRGVADIPDALDRRRPVQRIWRDPGLLFGQACGYPIVSDPTLPLRVLALPVYDAPFCTGDAHCSLIVVRRDDLATRLVDCRGRRAAVNDFGSNSGMNLFRAAVAKVATGAPFFESVVETGSHRASAQAIAAGVVDIGAIDAVSYAALDQFEPTLTARLRMLERTAAAPTLPFVTARTTEDRTVRALREALAETLADPALNDARAALFLTGAMIARGDRFSMLLALERDAASAGYPELR